MARTYGLIGYPLGHSFSRGYFTDFFTQQGIDAEYKNFELPQIGGLVSVLAEETDLQGFNVTIPYKQQVFAFLDEVDAAAQAIGAVNVVKVLREGGSHSRAFRAKIQGEYEKRIEQDV